MAKILFLATALFALIFCRGAFGQTVSSITASADVFVSENNSSNNYGADVIAATGPNTPKGAFKSFIKFDTGPSKALFDATYGPGNWQIQNAKLQLHAIAPPNAIFNSPSVSGSIFLEWLQDDSWVEGTGTIAAPSSNGVTWNTYTSYFTVGSDMGIGSPIIPVSGTSTVGLTRTWAPFVSDLSSGGPVTILLTPGAVGVSEVYSSREDPTLENRPILTLTAVPEPTGALILIGAIVVCAARRPRRT